MRSAPTIFESWLPMDSESSIKGNCNARTLLADVSFPMPLFYHDVVSIVDPLTSDTAMIHRRHALGLLAAASLLPSRGFANVAPQRSEIREALAKHFLDVGTVGTFVGYK